MGFHVSLGECRTSGLHKGPEIMSLGEIDHTGNLHNLGWNAPKGHGSLPGNLNLTVEGLEAWWIYKTHYS